VGQRDALEHSRIDVRGREAAEGIEEQALDSKRVRKPACEKLLQTLTLITLQQQVTGSSGGPEQPDEAMAVAGKEEAGELAV
jgi:hypothetical protein